MTDFRRTPHYATALQAGILHSAMLAGRAEDDTEADLHRGRTTELLVEYNKLFPSVDALARLVEFAMSAAAAGLEVNGVDPVDWMTSLELELIQVQGK